MMLFLPVVFYFSGWSRFAGSLRFAAWGIAVENPQRGTSEDLERKARPAGARPNFEKSGERKTKERKF